MSDLNRELYSEDHSRQLSEGGPVRIPSLELAMGLQFNECSIAASEACRRATELMNDPDLYAPEMRLIGNFVLVFS